MRTELVRHSHVLTGHPTEVKAVIRNAAESGRLVSSSPLRPIGHGLVASNVVLLQPAQRPAEAPILSRRTRVTLAVSGAVLGSLAVLGYLLAVLVQWIVANAAVLIGSGLVLVLGAGLVLRIGGRSGGRHNGMGWHYTKCGR